MTSSEDTVIAELVPGYRLHDRLLRPAIVRVVRPRNSALRQLIDGDDQA